MSRIVHLSPRSKAVHLLLVTAADRNTKCDGWCDVYLHNAIAGTDFSATAFAGHLGALEKAGLYKPVDNFAWGKVKS